MATAVKCHLDTGYFFQQLASAEKRFLILDFDSTIARLNGAPESRFPCPRVSDLLECIAASAHTRLILASTASPRELKPALAWPDCEIWACDGQQRIAPGAPGSQTKRVPLSVHSQVGNDNDCRRTLIDQRSSHHPLAYLVGATGVATDSAHEMFVVPELHLSKTQVLTVTPEPLVQFLTEWLRVCAGEIC
jgi:hypothetical protein